MVNPIKPFFHYYPYLEYGLIEGEIQNLYMVPVSFDQGSYYTAEIKLSSNLETNYKRKLPFNQEIQGYAEIIIKDHRLIEGLVEPLVFSISRKILTRILLKLQNRLTMYII